MTNIRIGDLEDIRINHRNAMDNTHIPDKKIYYGYSKFMAWRDAAIFYHKVQDENIADQHLEDSLTSKFKSINKNSKELIKYRDKLINYISDHINNSYSYIDSRTRIKIPLSSSVVITGEVPIINMTSGGYCLIYFSKNQYNWENDIKFPLLQSHFAEVEYSCNLNDIQVGIYCFETDSHNLKTFSKKSISDALDELNDVFNINS